MDFSTAASRDLDDFQQPPNSPFSQTYSPNASYRNSPFINDDLDLNDTIEISIDPPAINDDPRPDFDTSYSDYDPSHYDAPGDTNLFFSPDEFMATLSQQRPIPSQQQHHSPSSSAGGDYDNQAIASRSRASSVSSTHALGNNNNNTSTFNLENMTFGSPQTSYLQGMQNTSSPAALIIPSDLSQASMDPTRGNANPGSGPTTGSPSPTRSDISAHSAFSNHSARSTSNLSNLPPNMHTNAHPSMSGPNLGPGGPGIQIVPATPIGGGGGLGHGINVSNGLGIVGVNPSGHYNSGMGLGNGA